MQFFYLFMKKTKNKEKKPLGKRLLRAFAVLSIVASVLSLLTIGGVALWLSRTTDTESDVSLFESFRGSRTTRFYYNVSQTDAVYTPKEWESERLHGGKNAIWCPIEEMPSHLQAAFVAIEDKRFFEHDGVDWLRTGKAFFNYILHFDDRFGGSGITQQLIKNISGENDPTPRRKLKEIYRAVMLEKRYSKQEILEMYLNIVPMGEGCAGVGAAAERYFDKKPYELTVAESATLAAIINAPSRYNPLKNPQNNKERRDLVLEKMYEEELISFEVYKEALAEEPLLQKEAKAPAGQIRSWYTETVISDVLRDLVEAGYSQNAARQLLYNGGLQIYTLVDPFVQEALEKSAESVKLEKGLALSGVILDPSNGNIVGICGGNGEKKGNRLLNYATVNRAPGSALKPLSVYAPAIDRGLISYASVFDDVPLSYTGSDREWPRNSPTVYDGLCDIKTAVAKSKNTVAVEVLRLVGTENSYALLSRSLGLTGLVRSAEGGALTDLGEAPLALGQLTYGVSLRELCSAYTPLASDGTYKEGRTYIAVYDGKGELLLKNEAEEHRVFTKQTAAIMTKLLEGVVNEGTAKGVSIKGSVPIAGKTGTTSESHDKWFIGYTPHYICGIWCGAPDKNVSVAGKPQLSFFNTVMNKIHEPLTERGEAMTAFPIPEGVYECRYCKDGGALLCEDCMYDPRGSRASLGWFTAASLPKSSCTRHISVLYDTENGGVAEEINGEKLCVGEKCEREGLTRVSLLSIPERSFKRQVYITDAQYVYRPLNGAAPADDVNLPFFYNTLLGQYVGISKTVNGRQYNSSSPGYIPKEESFPWEENPFFTEEFSTRNSAFSVFKNFSLKKA